MDRNVSPLGSHLRGAGTVLAAAVASALLLTGCSSDSGDGGDTGDDAPASEEQAPEAVRFTELPNACETVEGATIEEVVPEASDEKGEELPSADVTSTNACLWSGLDGYDFRSLTVTLKRFDSDAALGAGDSRAETFLQAQGAEITDDETNEDIVDSRPEDLGDEAVSLAFTAEKASGDTSREFRQHRVVVRTANVVVTVDYAGAGFEDAELPEASAIQEGAERIASDAVAHLDALPDAGDDAEAEADAGDDD
ncbi:DUF3558 domain-containing protein [Streptomyces otsuchiensis]|uniref:DUF3558 domain-containing protein n=1 Tax=Streptomyces otsuchiensis TaxID=2681388 RepID=UPI001031249A|nr:DUF3558 domain-containing protein [Streptomyces otsuchiensis]